MVDSDLPAISAACFGLMHSGLSNGARTGRPWSPASHSTGTSASASKLFRKSRVRETSGCAASVVRLAKCVHHLRCSIDLPSWRRPGVLDYSERSAYDENLFGA